MKKGKNSSSIILIAAVVVLLFVFGKAVLVPKEIQVGALCYHNFHTEEEVENGLEYGQYSVYVEEFEEHLQYLQANGIRAITVSELLEFIDGKINLPEKCMLITVDDCSISFYQKAYPVLQKYNIPANIAVIGNRIDGASAGNGYRELYCTWDEIAQMAEDGLVEFGSHSYYLHDKENGRTGTMLLSTEGLKTYKNVLMNDMIPLNKKLEEVCGYVPRFFAYPYYAVSMASIPTMVNDLNYPLLFAGNSDSVYRYCGESVHLTNYNSFTKGKEAESPIIKRYTPRAGDNFSDLVETIFYEE